MGNGIKKGIMYIGIIWSILMFAGCNPHPNMSIYTTSQMTFRYTGMHFIVFRIVMNNNIDEVGFVINKDSKPKDSFTDVKKKRGYIARKFAKNAARPIYMAWTEDIKFASGAGAYNISNTAAAEKTGLLYHGTQYYLHVYYPYSDESSKIRIDTYSFTTEKYPAYDDFQFMGITKGNAPVNTVLGDAKLEWKPGELLVLFAQAKGNKTVSVQLGNKPISTAASGSNPTTSGNWGWIYSFVDTPPPYSSAQPFRDMMLVITNAAIVSGNTTAYTIQYDTASNATVSDTITIKKITK